MTSKDVAIDILSTLGAVFWSIQLIPQIYINYKRKTGDGLQPSMMIAWSIAGLPLGIHNILSNQPIALQIQAQILTCLSLLTWSQVMFYDHNWKLKKTLIVLFVLTVSFASIECLFIFGFKYGTRNDFIHQNVILSMAILAAIGLSFGVLRHYYDIYQHKTVRGIAWTFVFLDAAGDLTSLLSVTIRSPADKVAAGIYASELGLWIGIMIAGLIFNGRRYILNKFQIETQEQEQEVEVNQSTDINLERQSTSVSSAFSMIVPDTSRGSTWLMRRIRNRQQVATSGH